MSHNVSPTLTMYSSGAPEANGTGWLICCIAGWLWLAGAGLAAGSIEDEPLGTVEVLGAGGGASLSSLPNGFKEQPAIEMASAITATLRPVLRHFLSGDIIDGCSIIVVCACPLASVAIICRVESNQAAKHVTISAQNRLRQPGYQAALSAMLFNKVKNLGLIIRNSHEY